MKRREFLKFLGGGIIISFSWSESFPFQEERRRGQTRPGYPADFNAYLRIGEDGRVTCFSGKIEQGQGVIIALAQMLAEELSVPAERVDMVMGDTDICPWDMGTFGSQSVRFFGPALRAAGAEARAVLMELGSERLKVPVSQLEIKDGVIFDKAQQNNKVTYAELTQGKKIERHLDKKPELKNFSEFKVIGQSIPRPDAVAKVTGQAKYAGDIRFPDMLYARILRPPSHEAKLKSVDLSAAKKLTDVQVVQDGDLIAVLHKTPDGAEKALTAIKAQYEIPEAKVDDRTIFDHLLKASPPGSVIAQGGNLESGEKLSSKIFEKTYLNSYVAHATLETHTAMAKMEGNKVEVWASTQAPFRAKDEIAQVLGLPPENVRILTPFVGGGFGGKTRNKQAVEAARLAKLVGKPVQVAWSRAEEFFYDTFRPAAIVKIKSGTSDSGNIMFWDYHVYYAGERGSQHFYEIPHHSTSVHGEWMGTPSGAHPFGVGAWRAPACNTNSFARESQVDIMASEAGIDPVEFRLKNLNNKRMQRVIAAAAQKFGWIPPRAPSGRGFGFACGDYLGTYLAITAEVEVNKETGHVQVKRLVCAQDMGIIINPEGARLQIEGCLTMGLGYALKEEIHFKGGEIRDLNFDTYEITHFSWLPKIETVLVENPELSPQGGGEPAIICMGAVVANAIYDATGVRLFQLPMTPERIKAAAQLK